MECGVKNSQAVLGSSLGTLGSGSELGQLFVSRSLAFTINKRGLALLSSGWVVAEGAVGVLSRPGNGG